MSATAPLTASLPPGLSLGPLDTRILGVLVEKQHTVPDTYPLSLNALAAGCNQKTNRDPVMQVEEADVLAALDNLRSLSLLLEASGGRVSRYAHNLDKVLQLPGQSVALLATLMLRGPQTAAELRNNSERLHRFADISAVEGFLEELAQRPAGPLVVRLSKMPGSRENRWAHLLCGEPETPAAITTISSNMLSPTDGISLQETASLRREVNRLTQEVNELRSRLDRIYSELEIKDPAFDTEAGPAGPTTASNL